MATHRADDMRLAAAIQHVATPLQSAGESYDAVMECIGDAPIVLLGEATHGTHEFYQARADLTRRLITEKGFCAVCIEGDFPHAERVQQYVQRRSVDVSAYGALATFERFPQWMWRNETIVELVEDLRELARDRFLGFYGLDLYSLHESMAAVIAHLDRVDAEAARLARSRYACFDHFGRDPQEYGMVTSSLGGAASCEDEVVEQLVTMQKRSVLSLSDDDTFGAEMNAQLVRNAEAYYRMMFRGRVKSWNLRDTHMADTLDAIIAHLDHRGAGPKVVVWAHNSHIGDARATELGDAGELNLGQLMHERHGAATRLIGFSTYEGTVTAASDWDAPAEQLRVRRALAGSYEKLFHEVGIARFFLDLRRLGEASGALHEPRLERAIGVVYRPETERMSHYFQARLPEQFDGIIHFDHTEAVVPLERDGKHAEDEAPDTYPSAL
jgi:erythromycin esterase-like protein